MNTPVLSYPDYELPFILDTNAGKVGTGAVLAQVQGNSTSNRLLLKNYVV